MWTAGEHELHLLPVRGDAGAAPSPARLRFETLSEPEPAETWQASFEAMWPAYRDWYLKEGETARPDLATCRAMLKHWMPELVPTFERLVELTGSDPLAARFLSMYRPPGFVVGCSQAAFTGDGGPVLVRNYDYPGNVVSWRFDPTPSTPDPELSVGAGARYAWQEETGLGAFSSGLVFIQATFRTRELRF